MANTVIRGDVPAEITWGQGGTYDLPSASTWYVCNRSGVIAGDGSARTRPLPSVADAIAKSAAHDTVYILAEHAENITASNTFSGSTVNTGAMTIPVGIRFIGEGYSTRRPTLTCTATDSTLLFSASGCSIENCIIRCPQSGSTTTTALITVSASSCAVKTCSFTMAATGTATAATGISLGSSAANCLVADNIGFTFTGVATSWVSTSSTTAPGRVNIVRNVVRLLLSSASGGVVDLSASTGTAPSDWYISDNRFANLTAASTVAVKGVASGTGHVVNNYLETVNGAAATAITTPGNMTMYGNLVAQAGKQAIAVTVGGNSA